MEMFNIYDYVTYWQLLIAMTLIIHVLLDGIMQSLIDMLPWD
jgi:hypothetical protein